MGDRLGESMAPIKKAGFAGFFSSLNAAATGGQSALSNIAP